MYFGSSSLVYFTTTLSLPLSPFGAIYAAGTFQFSPEQIHGFGVALNVFAGLGAFGFSFLEDRIGSRKTIIISLICLSASSAAAVFVETKAGFWACAIVLGILLAQTNQ